MDGNIQAEGHAQVVVYGGSFVGGSVQIGQGGNAIVGNTTIGSDLQVEQNTGRFVLARNVIGGNLQANQNSGPLVILTNQIDGNLQCQANNPPPTGGGNQASDKEDQCANL